MEVDRLVIRIRRVGLRGVPIEFGSDVGVPGLEPNSPAKVTHEGWRDVLLPPTQQRERLVPFAILACLVSLIELLLCLGGHLLQVYPREWLADRVQVCGKPSSTLLLRTR